MNCLPISGLIHFRSYSFPFLVEKAEKSNIRLDDVPPLISADAILKTQEGFQDVIVKEESTGQARAEEQLSNEQAEAYRRQMGDTFCAMVVRSLLYNCMLHGKNERTISS